MQFGVLLPNSGPLASRENVIEAAHVCEDLGYHSVWVHDHIVWWKNKAKHHYGVGSIESWNGDVIPNLFESLITLSYIAGRTEKLKLGTAVLCLPFRESILLAKQTATLDFLSDGRLIFGVGVGNFEYEFNALNVPFHGRGSLTDEVILVLKEIWTKPLASFEGKNARFSNIEIFPKPKQKPHPPIWIGGKSDYALRRVARLGNGWLPAYLTPGELNSGRQRIHEYLKEYGRDTDISVAIENYVCISNNPDEVKRLSEPILKRLLIPTSKSRKINFLGSPEDIVCQVRDYHDVDVKLILLRFICRDITGFVDSIEFFSDEVKSSF